MDLHASEQLATPPFVLTPSPPLMKRRAISLQRSQGTTSNSSIRSDSVSPAHEETRNIPPKESNLEDQTRGLKRNRRTTEDHNAKHSKRQLIIPATPSSSPFKTLMVTKSRATSDHASHSEAADISSCSTQVPNTTSQHSSGCTTMEQLTAYPTRKRHISKNQLGDAFATEIADRSDADSSPNNLTSEVKELTDVSCLFIPSPARIRDDVNGGNGLARRAARPDTPKQTFGVDPGEEYPLGDDLAEEDIACLLEKAHDNVKETCIPPSSVTQAWDHDSRSAVEYDPTLQHSSPFPSPGETKGSQSVGVTRKRNNEEDNLLDDEVDWNTVYAMTSTFSKDPSTTDPLNTICLPLTDQVIRVENSIEKNPPDGSAMPLKPFVRPSFPEKVRDRSTVPGLSSNTMLRTCFRIGEMINQAAHCLNHRQYVVFELFARVTYSNRESLQRRQHFQFVDLFKDQLPYPAGILTDWRIGSQLDRQSSSFLGMSAEPRICRCICRPIKDPKITIGLSLVVLAIRESDWVQIKWAKHIVCGGSADTA
ncbi:hypothetical protein F4804DRAFT_19607 [Jackrogersella minutella]|nr:hypothetical protein F4804DRAFT_19607 [Jackrogersella minutella]